MPTTLLIGANSDIAHAVIDAAAETHDIALITRDLEKLPSDYQKLDCYQADAKEHKDICECIKNIAQQKEITNVINFCGSILLKPAGLLTIDDWKQTIDINLTSAFNVAHAVANSIKENCGLIFFSTAAASIGLPNHEAIAAAKGGVESLSRSFAASYADKNLRSNVIAPGLVETKLSKNIFASSRGKELSLDLHGLNRLGKPMDIASLVLWLLSPDNNWITGETFHIDGGLSTIKTYPNK